LLERLGKPVCVHQFVKDFLEDIFSVTVASNSRTDKSTEARLFPRDYIRQTPILLSRNSVGSQDALHLTL
jgi:hypothetical protein